MVEVVEGELAATQRELAKSAGTAQSRRPTRVEVVPAPPTPLESIAAWLDRFTAPAATAGIVLLFVVLILLDRSELRDRLVRLLGGSLHRTTDALDEAARRVSKYLSMQLVVNLSFAVPMAAGLWFIGVPGAILWGLVAAVLRFIPYLGPMVAAAFPLLLAFAVDPGWDMLLWTAALIAVLELVSNNIIEPWLYGSSTGLSTFALILAATFWTALWGPIGLVLSTPLTVCLLVVGRHLPNLEFLDVLLGSEPALDAPTRLYQRLLAGDRDEALELATEFAQAHSPREFYDQIGIGVLRLASADHSGAASAEHRHRVNTGFAALNAEMRAQHVVDDDPPRVDVLCIGGRWVIDTLAAEMAAHSLALDGVPAVSLPAPRVSADFIARLDPRGAKVVCLSYFSPEPQVQAKVFCRRLKRRWPSLKIVLALWNVAQLPDAPTLEAIGAEAAVASLDGLLVQTMQQLGGDRAGVFTQAPIGDDDVARVRALRESGALDAGLRGAFDAAARRAADIFDVPVALVSLVDDEWQLTHGDSTQPGRPDRGEPERGAERALSLCGHVVAGGQPIVVADVARDPRFAANPLLQQRGIRFYAGAPLRDDDGFVLGTLCLLDTEPRSLGERDTRLLASMANEVVGLLRERKAQLELQGAQSPAEALADTAVELAHDAARSADDAASAARAAAAVADKLRTAPPGDTP